MTSLAAGPSTLAWMSCQGSLGPWWLLTHGSHGL